MKFNGEAVLEKVQPVVSKLQTNKYMQGISQGFMMALPIVIMGSFALILKIIPIQAYKDFINSSGIGAILSVPMKFTTSFTAVIYSFCIAYRLAQQFKSKEGIIGLLALVSLFIVTPYDMKTGQITTEWLGSQGIFTAMIVAILTTKIYVFIEEKGWSIKMPDSVPPFISNTFSSLIPAIIILTIFTGISAVFSLTAFGSIHKFIFTLIQAPLTKYIGGNLISALIIAFLCQLCWLFGIHGLVVLSLVTPIWQSMDAAQLAAAQAGEALPNILGYQFNGHYASNSVLPIAILLMIISKSKQNKTLAKIAFIPACFSISEPLVFGLPIILNPIYALPWMLFPLICVILPYTATAIGLIPPMMAITLPFGTPMIVSGFLQGSWKIAAMQVVLILIGCVLFYPFVKYADSQLCKQEQGIEN
ncbi:PTS transporter subunit EIIC [Clostridium sp. YIM B02506]|uniref:PTS sugar transporter subunit IIC n=1 Tax=Clostridium sp. YIM B02506 TaxID=2910680 RepID=UPI001EEE8EF0|nr:PTS transporter subunit EIIC [Clostridium sp. YIM B02506]